MNTRPDTIAEEILNPATRQLDEADILRLESSERGVMPIPLKKVSERHHRLARALAQGKSPAEAGLETGYSPSRISILKADPSFQELLTHYARAVGEVFVDAHKNLASLMHNAVSELSERLEESPETFSNRELLDLTTSTADRTGFGPQSKLKVSGGIAVLDAADIAKLKEQASGTIIDISERSAEHPEAPNPEGAGMGEALSVLPVVGSSRANSSAAKGIDVSTPRNGGDREGVA